MARLPTLYLARYLVPICRAPFEDGALLVTEGRISAMGRRSELLPGFRGEVVDFGDAVLLPSFANTHTHLELSHYPRWAAGAEHPLGSGSFIDWLLQLIAIKRSRSRAELGVSLLDGLQQCLKFGTGAVGDILSTLPIRCHYKTSPLYGRCYFELLGVERPVWQAVLGEAESQLARGGFGCLQPGLAPHSPYSLSTEALEAVFSSAGRQGWPVTTHCAESAHEYQLVAQGDGEFLDRLYPAVGWNHYRPKAARCSPVEYLHRCGGLQPWNLLVHGVQVSAADCLLLAKHKVTVVLCPRSNERLGVGRAPVVDYQTAGVRLTLGTDSLASNDSLSLWDELAAARRCYGDWLEPAELLDMATRSGAEALGLNGEMGTLQIGSGGHFQVLPLASPPPLAQLQEMLCSEGCSIPLVAHYLNGLYRLRREPESS